VRAHTHSPCVTPSQSCVTREDCSTYGRHSLHCAYSLTVPGRHSSLPRLLQTGISSILHPLLSTHVHLYVLLAHPHFLACLRSTSGEEITLIAVHISATGLHATWASTSFQDYQTGSPHLCPAPVVMMITDNDSMPEQRGCFRVTPPEKIRTGWAN
jgi:hypothetical protein